MERISTNLPNDNMQFYLRERQRMMLDLQNRISGQNRILDLRDDPLDAAHATRYRSYEARLARFSENTRIVVDRQRQAEGNISRATALLQRARELAIQGANGTYAPEDLGYMATEVNEILDEFVELANARDSDGTTIFSGDRSRQLPFRALSGMRADGEDGFITEVRYVGTINPQYAEIAENSFIRTNFAGNEVFWAENQQIASRTDARGYQVDQDGSFFIDGIEIPVRAGDTAFTVVRRINDSGAAVEASIDPVFSSVVLQTTSPHQLYLEEGTGSPVLTELGLVTNPDAPAPGNVAPSAVQSGGSVFDALIALRDQLRSGDQEAIGSRGIAGLDASLDSMFATLGRIGAVSARLDGTYERLEMEQLDLAAQRSRAQDIDFAEAITELRLLENTHRAALGVSARVIQPTLLDFLR